MRKGISEPHRANNRYEYDNALRALRRIEEQLDTAEQERDRISREGVGSVLKWSERAERAEAALRRIADLTSQEVQFAAVGGEGGVMRRIAREALNPVSVGSSDKAGGAPTSPATYPAISRADESDENFDRALLRADIRAGNSEAAELQLQRLRKAVLEDEAEGTFPHRTSQVLNPARSPNPAESTDAALAKEEQ